MARTLIKSDAPVRRALRVLAGVSCTMPLFFVSVMFALFGPQFIDNPFVQVLLVVNVSLSALAVSMILRFARRWVDIEAEPGRIRLPFQRHLERGGWRGLDEILFASRTPTEAEVARASEVVKDKKIGTGTLVSALEVVKIWKARGGVLVITDDEILRVPRAASVGDKIVAHIEGIAPM